jgi:Fe-S cluster biogenesis protein NfuA
VDHQGVELAIEELRPSFEADSFTVTLERLSSDGDAVICIGAEPEACLDCMIPDHLLQQVVEASVRRHAPDVRSVTVVKRGLPAAPPAS